MESERIVRRKHAETFKREAVELVLRGDRTAKAIANDLGINATMLNRWTREFTSGGAKGIRAFPGKGYLSPMEEEVRRLRKDLRDVTEERDILKKATAIFSRVPR